MAERNNNTGEKPGSGGQDEMYQSGSGIGSDPEAAQSPAVITDTVPDQSSALGFPIVGIGGSAGSLEAFIDLFQHIPPNTGMAYVVVTHMPPDQTSHLCEILSRATKMPTVVIESGVRPAPDHVYVLPPNASTSLQSGMFVLEPRPTDGPFHPIDSFFRSLASSQRHLAVAVVLSGMDSDGASGLRAIKGEAGITLVQTPETARYPEMPRSSISTDQVDMILPPDQIAAHLAELSRRFRTLEMRRIEQGAAEVDDERHFGRIIRLLKGVSGVDFRLYKPTTLHRRIARRMLMLRIDSLADYVSMLQADPKELRDLQEDILISVTRFFRDPEVFETLKQSVFPAIFEARPPDQQVRIWMAGCSSGEEVYSIAICLLEFLTGNSMEPSIQIFGTDASETSIKKARLGIYPETITSEVSPERLRRFFVKTEKGYQIAKRIRDLCIFARQNLCSDPPFSRLDLISCRNVLIYFSSELQQQLIPTFHYALRQNGFLLLGASETIRDFADLFAISDRKHKIYSKIGSTPPRGLVDVMPRVLTADMIREPRGLRVSEPWRDYDIQRAADRTILARYAPPAVVVNENMEILQSRGHTSLFLEMASGTASLQLSRMLRDSIAPQVTAAVRRAINEDLPVKIQGLQLREADQIREITVEVLPMHAAGARSRCYLVLFLAAAERSSIEQRLLSADTSIAELKSQDKDRLIMELGQELSSTRLYLQSLLEERDAKNQELISANEEIQSANEELQSTNEELETTKEELQSANEELQTVNDELQNRNAVLTQASNDLSNLLNSVNLPVLMLSSNLSIRYFTPQAQKLINVRAADIGRPFSEIRLNLNIDNLEPLFTEVLETLAPREIEVQDREGHWYLLRIRPYRTTDNKIDGLVIVLLDIDQLRRSQQELRDARDFAQRIIECIPVPLVVVDSELRIQSSNEAFCSLAGSSQQGLEKRMLPDLAASLWGTEEPLHTRLESLRAARAGQNFAFEYTASGEHRIFLVRGRVLQPGSQQFLLVTFEDVSAQKEAERLLKAERERLAREVESATKELNQSREELRALSASLLTSQEEERRRLARELHDDISQRLAAIHIAGDRIAQLLNADHDAARLQMERYLAELGRLGEDVRLLSHRLHPSVIEDLGLAPALRSLAQEFAEREGMIASFITENVPERIPLEVATGLYRIAQEALRNVAKHAGKTHVKLILKGENELLTLQISDAGRGFDLDQRRPGLGLISMKERARLIGATLELRSAPHEGTQVTVRIALAEQTSNHA